MLYLQYVNITYYVILTYPFLLCTCEGMLVCARSLGVEKMLPESHSSILVRGL